MRRASISYSAGLHFFVLAALTVTIPWAGDRDIFVPPPITIEFAEIDKITQAPKPPPKKAEEPKKPPRVSKNTSQQPVVPKRATETVPLAPAKPPPVPVKPPKREKPKPPPEPTPEPVKEEAPEPDTNETDFSSVLKNLEDSTPEEKPVEKDELDLEKLFEDLKKTQNIPLGERFTISEQDALRRQLERCWNVPIGARDVEDMVIEVYMEVNPDRMVRSAKIVNQARYKQDSFFRAVADSAIRAVRHPNCSPLALPPDKFESWKRITVSFNPKDMF